MVYATCNGMIVSMDGAGRVVLPKPLREQFNLHAGSQLEIIPGADGMELKPVETKPSLVKVNGWWVHQGVMQGGATTDPVQVVEQSREERINSLISLVMPKKR
jgi:AbrB family looped-hinge helix DNA binding protein